MPGLMDQQVPPQAEQNMGAIMAPDSGSAEEAQVRQQMAQIAAQFPPEMLQQIMADPQGFLEAVAQQLMQEQGLDQQTAAFIATILLEEVMKVAQEQLGMEAGPPMAEAGAPPMAGAPAGGGAPPQGGGLMGAGV